VLVGWSPVKGRMFLGGESDSKSDWAGSIPVALVNLIKQPFYSIINKKGLLI